MGVRLPPFSIARSSMLEAPCSMLYAPGPMLIPAPDYCVHFLNTAFLGRVLAHLTLPYLYPMPLLPVCTSLASPGATNPSISSVYGERVDLVPPARLEGYSGPCKAGRKLVGLLARVGAAAACPRRGSGMPV